MSARLNTRFTERFGIERPVALAPMDKVAGGALAATVSAAGGLGVIGGGYGDAGWVEQAFADAGNQPVGIGFITWSALRSPGLIERVIDRKPAALMVSFGDAEEIVAAAKAHDIPTLWQVQRLSQARQALAAGVDVIVVQGQEGGGHGMDRGLTSLLPAVRDLAGPEQILLAAGGIADGRGLAAALMLGADGVMLGTRLYASREASASEAAKAALLAAQGDATLRTKVFDVARGADWPWYFTGRVVENGFAKRWKNDIDRLIDNADAQKAVYDAAAEDDFETRVLIAGEAVDLIDAIEPAADILARITDEASLLLQGASRFVV